METLQTKDKIKRVPYEEGKVVGFGSHPTYSPLISYTVAFRNVLAEKTKNKQDVPLAFHNSEGLRRRKAGECCQRWLVKNEAN